MQKVVSSNHSIIRPGIKLAHSTGRFTVSISLVVSYNLEFRMLIGEGSKGFFCTNFFWREGHTVDGKKFELIIK
jgi:hypothetical protein